jgi:hypothetical protein
MINKLLLVLLILLVIPNYSQELIVNNNQQSIPLNLNLTKQSHNFEKNDLSDNTQKTNGLNNGSYFDISPGIIYFDFGERAPGFISSINWCKNKYFALTALIEYLPSKTDILDAHVIEYKKDFGVYFGTKTGSKVGLIGSGIIQGLFLLVVITE